jgi:acetamidase/formamidase
MATYTIEPDQRTVQGIFSRELSPILTIESGDTVNFRLLDPGWWLEPPTSQDGAQNKFPKHPDWFKEGHALCGPVAIRGAQPGMTLEIGIHEIKPGRWGWTRIGDEQKARKLNAASNLFLAWTLDPETMTGRNQYGHTVALRPFMGVMGMPPNEAGQHSTIPPRFCGGNIDCKELVAGSTLYLPISVPDALFSVGDGHSLQGDGETCGTAIECPMERLQLSFTIHEDLHLTTPYARTPSGWITLGFHEDLDQAMLIALDAMIGLIVKQFNISRAYAYALASLVVDLRITQVVNNVQGVHALLPDNVIQQ